MVEHLNRTRDSESATSRAAYALWRLNWIHPFRGGNGRSSRALCYLVLCIDMRMMLPGIPTVPALIYERRKEYVAALRAVDASVDDIEGDAADISAMDALVTDVVTKQLASAIDRLSRGGAGGPR